MPAVRGVASRVIVGVAMMGVILGMRVVMAVAMPVVVGMVVQPPRRDILRGRGSGRVRYGRAMLPDVAMGHGG